MRFCYRWPATKQDAKPLTAASGKRADQRPTEVVITTGTPKHVGLQSPGSKASAVVSPSGLHANLKYARKFRPQHTCRRYAAPICIGLVCAALAIIIMTEGVLPWRDTDRDQVKLSCNLPFSGSSCFSAPGTSYCWQSSSTVAASNSQNFEVTNVCYYDTTLSDGTRGPRVVTGVATPAACEAYTILPSNATYTANPSSESFTVSCTLNKKSGTFDLAAGGTHAYAVFVFCVIVFCIFALGSLTFLIPFFYILRERTEWYCCTRDPSDPSKWCPHFTRLPLPLQFLLIILFFPLLAFYVVMWMIVVLITVRGAAVELGWRFCTAENSVHEP